jgi:hypothetical protein
MMTFLSPYNPQDLPKLLFKQCANCQEIAIIANVKYTNKKLLMNVIDLLTQSGLYMQEDLKDWDSKPTADKTWINLHPFIQEVYQRCLQSRTMTNSQGGYAFRNRFAPFQANRAMEDEVSNNDTAKTIAGTINLHFANILVKTTASITANALQVNVLLQQMVANNAQLIQQQQAILQQLAMLTTNPAVTTRRNLYAPPPTNIYAPPPIMYGGQLQYPPQGGGCNGSRNQGGHACCGHGGGGRGVIMPSPVLSVGNTGIIPYIPAGIQHPPPQLQITNIVKMYANQNVCFTCGFDVEDWHTSATCNCKKLGCQDGFTCSNYMEYNRPNHPLCRNAMHKTMYPSNF